MGKKYVNPGYRIPKRWDAPPDEPLPDTVGPRHDAGSDADADVPADQTALAVAAPRRQPTPRPKGIRDWTESVDGIPADRIRDCLVYQLDVARNPWWVANATRSAVLHGARRLNDSTPPDFRWDPDPLVGPRRVPLGGGEEVTTREILRRPRTPEERAWLRAEFSHPRFGLNDGVAKWLLDPRCPECGGKGKVPEPTYPDAPDWGDRQLTTTGYCVCVWK